MKKLFISMVVVMFTAVTLPSIVMAQDGSDAADSDTTSDQSSDSDASDDNTDSDQSTDRQAERQARIDAIKERVAERLDAAEEQRIANVCKAAQTTVNKLQENLNTATANRSGKYAEIIEKLNTLYTRLQQTTADLSALEGAINEIDSLSGKLISDINEYQQLLDDLVSMDCEDDPSGFKAVLTDARTKRGDLITQAKELKTYVTEDVRAILSAIKDQLSTTES